MERIKLKIMHYILLVFFCSFLSLSGKAQEQLDTAAFPNPVFVKPNPPKPVKGWEMTDYEGTEVLMGEYPGKILKFQFEGNAVGIAVIVDARSGILEYSVDNYPWQKQDLFVEGREHRVCYFTLESGLTANKHMLQIRMAPGNDSAHSKCLLSSFVVNTPE
jgi:hypothetical protein